MSTYSQLQHRTVYRHLDYAWNKFGVGLPHLALAAVPGLGWALLVALIAPDIFAVSLPGALGITLAGAAMLDAFSKVLVPAWPRLAVLLVGAAPGASVMAMRELPLAFRAALPFWPAFPVFAGSTVAVAVWQYRREPDALWVAWRWRRGPRLLDGHQAAACPTPPLPIDRAWLS